MNLPSNPSFFHDLVEVKGLWNYLAEKGQKEKALCRSGCMPNVYSSFDVCTSLRDIWETWEIVKTLINSSRLLFFFFFFFNCCCRIQGLPFLCVTLGLYLFILSTLKCQLGFDFVHTLCLWWLTHCSSRLILFPIRRQSVETWPQAVSRSLFFTLEVSVVSTLEGWHSCTGSDLVQPGALSL